MIKVSDKVLEIVEGFDNIRDRIVVSLDKISRIAMCNDECVIYKPNATVKYFYQEQHDLSEIFEAIKSAGHDNFIFLRGVIFNLDQIEKVEVLNCDIYNEYGVVVVPKGMLATYLFECNNEEEVIALAEEIDNYREEYEELTSGLDK